ncbi:MAG: hypothetical protein EOO80_20170, partial [Oxalobacteraceae bacterium]
MDHKKTADWELASGSWTVAANDGEIRLNRTVMGNAIAPALGPADIAAIMNMRRAHGASTLYPPDFNFSPVDGAQLAPNPPSGASWIAPSGASAITDAGMPEAVGLKRTRHSVPVDRLRRHDADSMADMELPLPPPGEYEFFSGTFGTVGAVLLALDTGKGT